MASHQLSEDLLLIASGGDDGSLALLLASTTASQSSSALASPYTSPATVVGRAHSSAVTACVIAMYRHQTYILTSGNDEWIRLWKVVVQDTIKKTTDAITTGVENQLKVLRVTKLKTNVADVSSMAVLDVDEDSVRVLICGVGMEVIRIST
jgi:WD40 repeat protein